MVSDPFWVVGAAREGTVQGMSWHVGMLARGEAEQVKGTGGQGDTGTAGEAERQRGKEIQGCEDPGRRNADPKILGGVGPSGI